MNKFAFANFDKFQKVEDMNPNIRSQQYGFNGRIFLDPFANPFNNPDNTLEQQTILEQQINRQNGLIMDYTRGDIIKPFDLFQNSTKPQDTNTSIISNIVVPNAVSRTFFSNDNMERIQREIIQQVYKVSQKQIGRQSYQELQVIMKSIYLQYGRNLPYDIEEQVLTLNKYVIDESIRIIVPNILQYNKYLEDITSPIPVMPLPQNVSNKGYKWGDLSSLIPSTISFTNNTQ
jgi:hypothetical protein